MLTESVPSEISVSCETKVKRAFLMTKSLDKDQIHNALFVPVFLKYLLPVASSCTHD